MPGSRVGAPSTPRPTSSTSRANYHLFRRTAPDARKSLEYFQEAVEKQPDYALAYAAIAEAYETAAGSAQGALSPREAFPSAKAAAMRAVELDPTLGEPYASLALEQLRLRSGLERRRRASSSGRSSSTRIIRSRTENYAMFLARMSRFDGGHTGDEAERRRSIPSPSAPTR